MNILIVDDERWACDGIKAMLQNIAYKIENVFTANNGGTALGILQKECIDIVITDIRMPVMDGIELVDAIRKNKISTKVVFISSYADFDYAQKALNMDVSGYLIKPVNLQQFCELMNKVVDGVVREKMLQAERHDEKKRYINKIFTAEEVIDGNVRIPEALKRGNEEFEVAVFYTKRCEGKFGSQFLEKAMLLKFIDDLKSDYGFLAETIYCCENLKAPTEFFVVHTGNQDADLFVNFITIVRARLEEAGVSVMVAVSSKSDEFTSKLYIECQDAYMLRLLNPEKKIFCFADIEKKDISFVEHKMKMLIDSITNRDAEAIRQTLKSIFVIDGENNFNVRYFYYVTINNIIFTLSKISTSINENKIQNVFLDRILLDAENMNDLIEYIWEFIISNMGEIHPDNATCKQIMKKVIEYINVHFMEDIGVNKISTDFAITPNYLSKLFKDETGETFSSYLTRIRIEKACELLKNTDFNINKISRSVGYTDDQYFYRVFKKVTGMTPINYRFEMK